ncbi:MAG: hypothetical protein N2556_07030, partial [Anaerolineae bacterium]|nr:hypothetical protein [Anaerolineae bacterium]
PSLDFPEPALHWHTLAGRMGSPCSDRDVRSLPHVHSHPNGDLDSDTHFHSNLHPHTNLNADTDAYINSHADIHPNPAANGDPPPAHRDPGPARAGERKPLD